MKLFIAKLCLVGMLCLTVSEARAAVNVFACEPEWGGVVNEIGGEHVELTVATTAQQDPHFIRAKPSLIAAVRKADFVVCTGASLEVGWLPILLDKAANQHVLPGTDGFMQVADYVTLLEKPQSLDRADGDVHPEGNPHLHLNPNNIAIAAVEISNRLQRLDPTNGGDYRLRTEDFSKRWNAAISKWETQSASLRGRQVIVHHKSLTYLLDWLGLREGGTLEPKPGIPPTSAHLEQLLQFVRSNPVRVILRTAYDPNDASVWLAEKTGIPAVSLPYTVGGDEESGDLFKLFDRTVGLLIGANDKSGH